MNGMKSIRLLCLGLLLVLVLGRFGLAVGRQLSWPEDLVYETPQLVVVESARRGDSFYDARLWEEPPYVINPYGPVYPLLVAALPDRTDHPYLTGRLVSLAAVLGLVGLVLLIGGRTGLELTLAASALLLLSRTETTNAAFMKADTLAVLFSSLAVAVAAHFGPESRRAAVLAALFGVLAVATKQSLAGGLAAAGLWYLIHDRRSALTFAAVAGGLPLGLLALGTAVYGEGVRLTLTGIQRQALTFEQWRRVLIEIVSDPGLIALLGLATLVFTLGLRRRGRSFLIATPAPAFLASSTIIMLITVAKVGSSINYVLEPLAALALLIAFGVRCRGRSAAGESAGEVKETAVPEVKAGFEPGPAGLGNVARARVFAAAALLAALEVGFAPPETVCLAEPVRRARRQEAIDQIRGEIRELGGERPKILNLGSKWATYAERRRASPCDPWLFRVLWLHGTLDPAPLIRRLDAREFDLVLIPERFANLPKLDHPLCRAVGRNYQSARVRPGLLYFKPKR